MCALSSIPDDLCSVPAYTVTEMLYDRPEKNSRQFNRGIDYATVLYSFAALTHFMSETLESCLTIEQSLYKRIENRKKRKETIFTNLTASKLSFFSSPFSSKE